MRLAAAVEQASEHPLAAAIVAGARGSVASRYAAATRFRPSLAAGSRPPLRGVEFVQKCRVHNGRMPGWTSRPSAPEVEGPAGRREKRSCSSAVDGWLAGAVSVADQIKPTTPEADPNAPG